jgi:hypothetical protein
MLKRLIIGGLVAILVGAVAVGVYDYVRGDSTLAYQGASGRNSESQPAADGRGNWSRGAGGNGGNASANQDRAGEAAGPAAGGGQGQGEGYGLGDGSQVPQPQASVEEWVTVQGTVTAVELNALNIETGDGEAMLVQLGPEHYWTAQGVTFEAGDEVEITGFYEDGTSFTAGQVTLLATGDTLALRDADGRPLWAGGSGRGNGARAGQES